MNEALIYLQEALGLSAKTKTWPGSARLPLHLRAIEVRAVDANGFHMRAVGPAIAGRSFSRRIRMFL